MTKNLSYSFAALAFACVIGAAVYEHLTVVPQWSAAPPASLTMFQGTYGLKPDKFWMLIHPVTLLLFVITLVLHWKTARRKNLLITLGGYAFVLCVTTIYFVPELISIITAPLSTTADSDLTARAKLWELLSIVRLGCLIVLSMVLFLGLTKDNAAKQHLRQPQNSSMDSKAQLATTH